MEFVDRRLPVFFSLACSESTVEECIEPEALPPDRYEAAPPICNVSSKIMLRGSLKIFPEAIVRIIAPPGGTVGSASTLPASAPRLRG